MIVPDLSAGEQIIAQGSVTLGAVWLGVRELMRRMQRVEDALFGRNGQDGLVAAIARLEGKGKE